MPQAKRLKVSECQEEEKDSGCESRVPIEIKDGSIPSMIGSEESELTENGDEEAKSQSVSKVELSTSEKEPSKRSRSKSLGDAMPEVNKIKEEAMKPVRISERLSIKRNRLGDEEDSDSPAPTPKRQKSNVSKQPRKASSSASTAVASGSSKRTESSVQAISQKVGEKKNQEKKHWAPWTSEETELFYTYLGLYGKNFDAISQKLAYIAKMRGVEPRTKLQVRYFYYRAMVKVSKLLQQNGGVKNVGQEVFNMINFGTLRRRLKESNPQFVNCLKELIQKGETCFSTITAKTRRSTKVKTPICTYIKALKQMEEQRILEAAICKLPTHVTVELTPKSNVAWSRVQELSQNPRVRFKLSTNRTLEGVFKYLNSKWKSSRLRLKESMGDKSETCDDELIFHLPSSIAVKPFTMKPVKSQNKESQFKSYLEQVFPNLLTASLSDLEKDDQLEGTSRIENGEMEKEKQPLQDETNCKDEGAGLDHSTKTEALVKDEPDSDRRKCDPESNDVQNSGASKEFLVSVSYPKDILVKGNASDHTVSEQKSITSVLFKSEPHDTEASNGECTSNQYLDFTPSGHLTVVSKSISVTVPSSSFVSSSSLPSSTASGSSSPSMPLKPNPQSLANESSSLPSSPQTSTSSVQSIVPSTTSKLVSSPLRQLTNALNLKPISTASPPSSSVSSPTSSSNLISTHSVSSPSLNNKKGARKKINFCDTKDSTISANSNNDDNTQTNSDSQTTDVQLKDKNESLRKEVDKEFERIHELAKSGFLLSNSNTVTLLHLCLLLGRASVIRLEYEWVKKQGSQAHDHPHPASCFHSNPMANSLRRLCHIAALELASLNINQKQMSISKEKNKSDSSESANTQSRKKASVRNYGTMTDLRITMPRHTIPLIPAGQIIHHHPHHQHQHNPQNHKIDSTIQVNGVGGEVFRVPVVPAYRPVISKEAEERLKIQQQEAKAIMQSSIPRSRLLKRRNVPRTKTKPIIVQRTLLPKVLNERMITYIQPSASHGQILVTEGPQESCIPLSSEAIAPIHNVMSGKTLVTTTNTTTTTQGDGNKGSQPSIPTGTNILELAVKSANITGSPIKDESNSGLSSFNVEDASDTTRPTMSSLPSSHPTLTLTTSENASLSLADQSNISISDLDISLASASMSNMGPDAGDKFLDSVLERSQQGFAGLITPVTKSSESSANRQHPPVISLDSSLSAFDLSGMKTPPHSSSPPSPTPIINSSPSKLLNSDQSWLVGASPDVSLSSILGEFSSFQGKQEPKLKTPSKSSMMSQVSLFDQSSSDAVDNPVTVVIPKPNFVSDMSLNSLLGDPSLSSPAIKVEGHDQQVDSSGGHTSLAPPHSLFSEVSQDSLAKLDVDVTLQGMVNDSSMDLVSKFEKLAAQMAENRQEQEIKTNTTMK